MIVFYLIKGRKKNSVKDTLTENGGASMKDGFSLAEEYVNKNYPLKSKFLVRKAKWREETASDAQLRYMSKLGIKPEGTITKGKCSDD